MDDVTADQLAAFDQAHAAVSRRLDELVAAFRAMSGDSATHPDVDLVGAGLYPRDHCDQEALAELLTVAISRLAHPSRSQWEETG